MRLDDLYRRAVALGVEADPRGGTRVEDELARTRREYEALPATEQEFFDREKLVNPYADTRILHGDPGTEVGCVLVGVDVEVGELLLADRLRERGRRIDAVLAHHPEGPAMAQFWQVMWMQADILALMGVPIGQAEGILGDRVREVSRRVMPANHDRAVDAARLLDIPLLCVHTPADNQVATFLQRRLDDAAPYRVEEVVDLLREVPEYRGAAFRGAGPTVVAGAKEHRAGKVFVDMTGGTEGSREVFSRLAATEVGTVVCMHLSEEHLKEAEKQHINVVVAGHIASDTLGMNLVLDGLGTLGRLEVVCCSGFSRVERAAAG